MAKEETAEVKKEQPDQKVIKSAKGSSVDWPIEVVSQDGDKFHDNDVKFEVGHKKAVELVKAKRVVLSTKGKKQLEDLEEKGFINKELLKGVLGLMIFLMSF